MKYWRYNGFTLFETPTGTIALVMGKPQEFSTEQEAIEYIDEINRVLALNEDE